MNEPRYFRPASLGAALDILEQWGARARPLAGGTDLLIALRRGLMSAEAVVDITRIDDLRQLCILDGNIVIGALVTHGEVRHSEQLAGWAPVLVSACREVGSPQIRNLGTIGGNLGNASPAGDTIPALYSLCAEVGLESHAGRRWVPVDQFFVGPGKTVRRPEELIVGVRFPAPEPGERGFFQKIGQRRAMRVSKVSAAGTVLLDGLEVKRCRLALGAVAPTVIRLTQAEMLLTGSLLSTSAIEAVAALAGELCAPIDDIRSTSEYRRTLATVLVRRGLTTILEDKSHADS